MPAFELNTDLYSHFRQKAQEYNCNPCFDDVKEEIKVMNERGEHGILYCLCKIGKTCPCNALVNELERDGVCHCGIFRRKYD